MQDAESKDDINGIFGLQAHHRVKDSEPPEIIEYKVPEITEYKAISEISFTAYNQQESWVRFNGG